MSQEDQDQGDEKPHEASAKRINDARERGQVAKSKELNAAIGLLGSALTMFGSQSLFLRGATQTARGAWGGLHVADAQSLSSFVDGALVLGLGLVLAVAVITAIASGMIQHGPLWATKALEPDLNKFNPVKGLKRILSPGQMLSTGAKAVALTLLIAGLVLWLAKTRWPRMISLAASSPGQIAQALWGQVALLLACCGGVMLIVGVLDLLHARHRQDKQLRMTHEEARREHKEQEGDPMFKARRRQRHMEMQQQQRMLDDVSSAQVVLNNPTHFSVALRYRPEEGAPMVVARGADEIARQIRERASEHGVVQIEDKPLARALYKHCRVGEPIPESFYRAIAKVLAEVYRQESARPRR